MDLVRKEGPDKLFNFIRQPVTYSKVQQRLVCFRGKGYHFMSWKILREADQIMRILDVSIIPLPRVEDVGNPLDIYQWKTLLDSTGAYEAYLQHYDIKITPIKIAELLIFNPQLPRSLLFCMGVPYNPFARYHRFVKNSLPIKQNKIGKLYYQIAYSNAEEIFFWTP